MAQNSELTASRAERIRVRGGLSISAVSAAPMPKFQIRDRIVGLRRGQGAQHVLIA